MAPQPDDKTTAIIRQMQSAIEGQANTDIVAACCYLIANAVAILAHDRADGEKILKMLAKDQRRLLDELWPGVRAELERRKLL